jgi:hypothetical protein
MRSRSALRGAAPLAAAALVLSFTACTSHYQETAIDVAISAVEPASSRVVPGSSLVFTWKDGIEADQVWVEKCNANCADKPVDWCMNKTGDPGRPGADGEGVWMVGFIAYAGDPPLTDLDKRVPSPFAYGACPDGWSDGLTRQCAPAPELEEGATYSVGMWGQDENGKAFAGCRFFRIEGGAPKLLQGMGL